MSQESMFCSETGVFGAKSTDTPPQCVKAPSQCVAFYDALQAIRIEDMPNVQMPSDECFQGLQVAPPTTYSAMIFGMPNGKRDLTPKFLDMSASTFFGSSQTAFLKADLNYDTYDIIGCVQNTNLSDALTTINEPVITYQMVAYMAPLAVTTDPDIIAGISMLVASSLDLKIQGLTLYNVTPGLYTGPADMSFQLHGMPEFEFYIPGIAEPDQADAATVKKKFWFKPGEYKDTAVLSADCDNLKNIPVTKAFRKIGVNEAAKTKPIQPGMFFNITECMTSLTMCEDIQKLETKCTECNSTQLLQQPCSLFSDAVCKHVPTLPPSSKSRTTLKENATNDIVLVSIGALVAVFIVIIAAQTIHRKRKHRQDPEASSMTQTQPPSYMSFGNNIKL